MPCAILAKRRGLWDRDTRQIGMLSVRFIDIRAFEAAKKQGVHDLDLPQKVYIGGKKVSTALEKDILPQCIEFAESVFDVEVQKAVTGLPFTNIMVEPTVVSFIIEGYVLDEKALRRMADFLLLLSDKVQKATVSSGTVM